MPEWLASCPRARQIKRLPLSPGFCAMTGLHPGQAVDVDTFGRHPFVVGGGRVAFQRSRNTMACHQMFWIEAAIVVYAPVEQFIGLIDTMLQPIQAFGIAAEIVWWICLLYTSDAADDLLCV